MKLGFTADIHAANHKRMGGPVEAGLNRRCRQVLETLRLAVQRAVTEEVDAFFVAGDIVDTTKPEPQIIAAIQNLLIHAPDPYLLLGNHDQVSEQPGDHALGPFSPVCAVVDRPVWKRAAHSGAEVLLVPFAPGDARVWLPRVVNEMCTGVQALPHRVLLLHLGLEMPDTPEFMQGSHDAVPVGLVTALCKKHGFEAAFAGNWHFHKVLDTSPAVVQIGSLAPTGFDNEGLEGQGSLVIWDTDARAMTRIEIPGPRFLKLKDTDPIPTLPKGFDLYVQVLATPDKVAGCVAALGERFGASLVDGEVLPDDTAARAAARTAAAVATSAETLEVALSGYVGQMPLPEGVDRGEVLSLARRYLGV